MTDLDSLRAAVHAVSVLLVTTALVAAPVPEHLFPPEVVKPGARWIESSRWDHIGPTVEIVVEVVSVKGNVVTYVIVGHPNASLQKWRGLDWNQMPLPEARKRLRGEAYRGY